MGFVAWTFSISFSIFHQIFFKKKLLLKNLAIENHLLPKEKCSCNKAVQMSMSLT